MASLTPGLRYASAMAFAASISPTRVDGALAALTARAIGAGLRPHWPTASIRSRLRAAT